MMCLRASESSEVLISAAAGSIVRAPDQTRYVLTADHCLRSKSSPDTRSTCSMHEMLSHASEALASLSAIIALHES